MSHLQLTTPVPDSPITRTTTIKSAKQTCCGGFVLAHVATHAIWLHHCGGCVKRHLQLQDLKVHKLALLVFNEEGISTTQVA